MLTVELLFPQIKENTSVEPTFPMKDLLTPKLVLIVHKKVRSNYENKHLLS